MSAPPSFVHIDRCVFERNRSGTVIASVWLDIGGAAFPAEMWDDFATRFLVALAESLLRLAKGEARFEVVHFYEGPYTVEMERMDASRLEMRGLKGDRLVASDHPIAFAGAAEAVANAGRQLLEWCDAAGWNSAEEQRLQDLVFRLKQDTAH